MAETKVELITDDQVRHVASLARLELTDQEVSEFSEQLAQILQRASRIQSLALEDVEATLHPIDLGNVLRTDVSRLVDYAEQIVAQGPQTQGPFIKAPKILEDESSA